MREMKDSGIEWIGVTFGTWSKDKGKYIFEYQQKPVKNDDGVITCFRDGEVTLRSNRREDGFTISQQEIGYQGIDVGDLIVHGMDGFAGAIGISDSRGKASPVLNNLGTSQDKKYYMYFLRTAAYSGVFIALSTGIRVRTCDTNWEKLRELVYLVPPLEEQKAIADFLDKKCGEIDEISSLIQEQIDTLEKYKKSVITEAVTKGLNKDVEYKDSRYNWLGMIPENWEILKVKDGFTRKKAKAYQEDPVVLSLARSGVKVRDISTNEGQLAASYFEYNPVAIDDILINPMDLQSGANCSISKVEGVISPAYINLRWKTGFDPRFYDYYFKIQYWSFAFFSFGKGVSFDNRWTLNEDTLMRFPLLTPPLEEQKAIADFLDKKCGEIDDIIKDKQAQLEKIDAYKKSLIYEYVTGKKEVLA